MRYSPEADTDAILRKDLLLVDPKHEGAFVEVGCGTSNYSFILAAAQGFRTFAVDPIPHLNLRKAISLKSPGTKLFTGVISDKDGGDTIYLHKGGDANFTSTVSDWMDAGESQHIQSWRWETFIGLVGISHITCLKLDVEGAEATIIKQLTSELLPKILVFEYGGGSLHYERKGGWTPSHYTNTLFCLATLRKLGYKRLVRLDSNVGRIEFSGEYQAAEMELFPPAAQYGNIVAFLN